MQISRQFVQYVIVGAVGFLLHLGLIAFQVEVLNFNYALAFITVLPVTNLTKFLLDKYWTFRRSSL